MTTRSRTQCEGFMSASGKQTALHDRFDKPKCPRHWPAARSANPTARAGAWTEFGSMLGFTRRMIRTARRACFACFCHKIVGFQEVCLQSCLFLCSDMIYGIGTVAISFMELPRPTFWVLVTFSGTLLAICPCFGSFCP